MHVECLDVFRYNSQARIDLVHRQLELSDGIRPGPVLDLRAALGVLEQLPIQFELVPGDFERFLRYIAGLRQALAALVLAFRFSKLLLLLRDAFACVSSISRECSMPRGRYRGHGLPSP